MTKLGYRGGARSRLEGRKKATNLNQKFCLSSRGIEKQKGGFFSGKKKKNGG